MIGFDAQGRQLHVGHTPFGVAEAWNHIARRRDVFLRDPTGLPTLVERHDQLREYVKLRKVRVLNNERSGGCAADLYSAARWYPQNFATGDRADFTGGSSGARSLNRLTPCATWVANAASNHGASMKTDSPTKLASPGWTIRGTNKRRSASRSRRRASGMNLRKHVLEARLHENPVLRVCIEALSRAMAITYTQPFSNNNRPSKARVADLPSRFHTPQ
jgi:hypothetical protein